MRRREPILLIFVAVLAILVRVVDLGADPPSTLSWSSGIYTDEGFYSLDARHLVQFGSFAPGDFHDRMVSPLLTLCQIGFFRALGPTVVAARLVSVGFGLATIVVLWLALRPHGARAAAVGALALAVMPVAVFYNRLALQETPAAFCLAVSLMCASRADRGRETRPGGMHLPFSKGRNVKRSLHKEGSPSEKACLRRTTTFWALAGIVAVAALAFKSLAVLAMPGLIWAAFGGEDRRRQLSGLATGGVGALAIYGLVWLWPNHGEIARMDRYYALHQAFPHSLGRLGHNIVAFWTDTTRGIAPYLASTAGTLLVLAVWPTPMRSTTPADRLAAGTLVVGLLALMAMDYTPSRYLVLLLPALCWRAGITAQNRRRLSVACAGMFVATSAIALALAAHRPMRTTAAASTALAHLASPGTLAIGEFAPRLCLGTPLEAAPIQPGLSNDNHPVERLHPGFVLVTRTPFWQTWWQSRYPSIVGHPPAATLNIGSGRYLVDVYRVPKA